MSNNHIMHLCPELQVALIEMEEEFNRACEEGKKRRQTIIEVSDDLFQANVTCSNIIYTAIEKRRATIHSLRDFWGDFIYDRQY